MSYLGLLDTTATIERATPSTNGMGETSLSWSEVATGVKCILQPARPSSILRDFGYQLEADYEAFFPKGTDLKPQDSTGQRDRVKVGTNYYTVLGVYGIGTGEVGKAKGIRAYLRRMA